MRIPPKAFGHRITVEPFLGRNAAGPVWGPPEVHRCLISDKQRLVRATDGREVTANHSIHLPAGTSIPVESRATVWGRPTTVIAVMVRDGGGLTTPDHVLILCE